MTLIDAIGFIAAVLATGSFVPQAWHTFKTKDVSGISLAMYSAFTLGITLWLIYGLLLRAWHQLAAARASRSITPCHAGVSGGLSTQISFTPWSSKSRSTANSCWAVAAASSGMRRRSTLLDEQRNMTRE